MHKIAKQVRKEILGARHFIKRSNSGIDQIIFIHVPKCAGTSVNRYIKSNIDTRFFGSSVRVNDIQLSSEKQSQAIIDAKRSLYVHGHMAWKTMASLRSNNNSFLFTFFRDPISRVISLYRYAKNLSPERRARAFGSHVLSQAVSDMESAEYFQSSAWRIHYDLNNFMVRQFSGDLNAIPTSEKEWNDSLERAKLNISQDLDFVGFHETFEKDFRSLLERLRIPQPSRVPRENATANLIKNSSDNSFDLNPDVESIIYQLTYYDQKLYDWARDKYGNAGSQ